jgi:hypothetical protein
VTADERWITAVMDKAFGAFEVRKPVVAITSKGSPYYHATDTCISVRRAFVTTPARAVKEHGKRPHSCWMPIGYVVPPEPMSWELAGD